MKTVIFAYLFAAFVASTLTLLYSRRETGKATFEGYGFLFVVFYVSTLFFLRLMLLAIFGE